MATIQTIHGENCLKLIREQYIRPMAYGDNWSQLRIFVRYGLEAEDATNKTGSFFIGLSSGGLEWNHPDCVIIGWFFGPIGLSGFPGFVTLTYNAAGYYQATGTNGTRSVVKQGYDIALANSPSLAWWMPYLPRRQMLAIEITRSAEYLIRGGGNYSTLDTNTYSSGDLLGVADHYGAAARGYYLHSSSTTMPAPQVPMDNLIICNFSSVPFCISNIVATRLI